MASTPVEVHKTAPAPAGAPDAWRSFRTEMDRLFDRFAGGWGMPSLRRMFDVEPAFRYESSFTLPSPAVDITEGDAAYKVTAELLVPAQLLRARRCRSRQDRRRLLQGRVDHHDAEVGEGDGTTEEDRGKSGGLTDHAYFADTSSSSGDRCEPRYYYIKGTRVRSLLIPGSETCRQAEAVGGTWQQ
jgi:hypothetical protein